MLFYLMLGITILCITIAILNREKDILSFIMGIIGTVIGVVTFFMGIIFLIASICNDVYIKEYETKKEVLEYQLNNNLYDNDNDIGLKELYLEIQTFNSDININHVARNNIWIYNLYSDLSSIEPIELK